jgi:hypothetical protein
MCYIDTDIFAEVRVISSRLLFNRELPLIVARHSNSRNLCISGIQPRYHWFNQVLVCMYCVILMLFVQICFEGKGLTPALILSDSHLSYWRGSFCGPSLFQNIHDLISSDVCALIFMVAFLLCFPVIALLIKLIMDFNRLLPASEKLEWNTCSSVGRGRFPHLVICTRFPHLRYLENCKE